MRSTLVSYPIVPRSRRDTRLRACALAAIPCFALVATLAAGVARALALGGEAAPTSAGIEPSGTR